MSDIGWRELEQQIKPQAGDIYILGVRAGRFNLYRYNGQVWEYQINYGEEDINSLIAPMQFLGESKGHRRYYRPTGTTQDKQDLVAIQTDQSKPTDETIIEIEQIEDRLPHHVYRIASFYDKEVIFVPAQGLLEIAAIVQTNRKQLELEAAEDKERNTRAWEQDMQDMEQIKQEWLQYRHEGDETPPQKPIV